MSQRILRREPIQTGLALLHAAEHPFCSVSRGLYTILAGNSEDLPRNVTFSVLANPPQRNKQEELQCSYGILRWQAVVKEINTGEAMVPVVDFWRVFVDGKYWGKTRSYSFCLKKSGEMEGFEG